MIIFRILGVKLSCFHLPSGDERNIIRDIDCFIQSHIQLQPGMMCIFFVHGPVIRAVMTTVLSLAWSAVALPAAGPVPVISLDQSSQSFNTSGFRSNRPQIHCDASLGQLKWSDCEQAIRQLPHDPVARPVLRNFYTALNDTSPTLPNQQLPLRETYSRVSEDEKQRVNLLF